MQVEEEVSTMKLWRAPVRIFVFFSVAIVAPVLVSANTGNATIENIRATQRANETWKTIRSNLAVQGGTNLVASIPTDLGPLERLGVPVFPRQQAPLSQSVPGVVTETNFLAILRTYLVGDPSRNIKGKGIEQTFHSKWLITWLGFQGHDELATFKHAEPFSKTCEYVIAVVNLPGENDLLLTQGPRISPNNSKENVCSYAMYRVKNFGFPSGGVFINGDHKLDKLILSDSQVANEAIANIAKMRAFWFKFLKDMGNVATKEQ